MKNAVFASCAVALALVASVAQAGNWRPTPAESDAFVRAYAFTVMQAVMEEGLEMKVESGKVTPPVAACLRKKMQLDKLLVPLRPIVAANFTSRKNLARATAFFLSPTGIKINQLSAQQLRNALRQASNSKQAAHDVQFVVTHKDVVAADKFNHSAAGREFTRFVDEGLPKLSTVDVFGDAVEKCVHDAGQ
jgi:hypothetical protein